MTELEYLIENLHTAQRMLIRAGNNYRKAKNDKTVKAWLRAEEKFKAASRALSRHCAPEAIKNDL